MKIALIIRKLNSRGGEVRQALSLAVELKRRGERVRLYAFSASRQDCLPELMDELEIVTLVPDKLRSSGGRLGFLAEDRMARELAVRISRETDLLNPHGSPAHHVAYYFKKYVRNIPSVWNVNELPFMRWPPEWKLEAYPAMHESRPGNPFLAKLKYYLKNRYDRRFVAVQDAIVTIDSAHRETIRRYLGRESDIAHSGVDIERFRYIPREPPAGKRVALLSSGILNVYRRFEDAISALAELVRSGLDASLTIVGDHAGDRKYHGALQALSRELGVFERVTFAGRVSDAELDRLLTSHDIFVYPHLQSQGIAVYEAMATGLACVIAQTPGSYETLTDGVHALLIPPKDPSALARAVRALVEDSELLSRISRQGAELVRSRFTWENYAGEVIRVFERILAPAKEKSA